MTPVDQYSIDYIKESNSILAKKGKTFFWARFLLKQEHAEDATRLYRFCRYIDDIGDESDDKDHAHRALSKVISEINAGVSNDPVISDALKLFSKKNIDLRVSIELIRGVMSDLKPVRIASEDQLASGKRFAIQSQPLPLRAAGAARRLRCDGEANRDGARGLLLRRSPDRSG
jgi:phytoene synthase